ncbi:VOC family protein [Algoriphagus machipongonensis]|uniref:VOC domain-containing protein n=1 Tax=Algoriphagus machipongonensis TaxID=388413 RepID=A3I1P2_9BACT|nr:VOC family protein [Algoriphagus machipongonensis]EAZ79708.1 hypothetical protein ALPR1_08788 [Algoriphagus machipongonensis]
MFTHTKAFGGFSVDDLQEAREFYDQVLGVEVKKLPMGLLSLKFQEDNQVLVYSKGNHEPANFTILNFCVEDIEEAVQSLSEKGVVFEAYDGNIQTDANGICRKDEHLIAWFKDPAGNILSLVQEDKS